MSGPDACVSLDVCREVGHLATTAGKLTAVLLQCVAVIWNWFLRQNPSVAHWIFQHEKMSHVQRPSSKVALDRNCSQTLCVISNYKDWFNMKIDAVWRSERPGPDPVEHPAPTLHDLPGGPPTVAPPDMMHTWHHGVGKHFVASCVAPWLQHDSCLPGWDLWRANLEQANITQEAVGLPGKTVELCCVCVKR